MLSFFWTRRPGSVLSSFLPRSRKRSRRRTCPRLEPLEQRFLPSTYAVDTLDDEDDHQGSDYRGHDGTLSLREAIQAVNHDGGGTINFSVAGTISLRLGQLPSLTGPTLIDGTSAPGYTGTAPVVELNGGYTILNALVLNAPGSTIKGLDITGFSFSAVLLNGGDAIEACFLGTDLSGTHARPNYAAMNLNGSGNRVGGTSPSQRNVISGNNWNAVIIGYYGPSSNNIVEGNYIGTDVTGKAALPNVAGVGIYNGAFNNTVGGTSPVARNVISSNATYAVAIFTPNTSGNLVEGNYIGTNAAGTAALPGGAGIGISQGATNNTIGGTAAGAGNVISGTSNYAIDLFDSGTSGNVVAGNTIGTDAAGAQALGNAGEGVGIQNGAHDNTIGGTTDAARNTIAASTGRGVIIYGGNANLVQGNYIGTDVNGKAALGNGTGVSLSGSAATNKILNNVISASKADGVDVYDGATGNRVENNKIGTTVTGTDPLGNGGNGVSISGNGTSNNTVGGTAAATRNIISANTGIGVTIFNSASSNLVQGNNIGTDITGTVALGNQGDGVSISNNANQNTIGGTAGGARNLISGNAGNGVSLFTNPATANNVVAGNYIGTDVDGKAAAGLGNGGNGVTLSSGASNNTVGGTDAGAGNLITGNAKDGVAIFNDQSTTNNVVAGNTIGIGATGAAVGNGGNGVSIAFGASNNTIGGTTDAARNFIAGNGGAGIAIYSQANNNQVQGNYIGTDVTGQLPLANQGGVIISNGAYNNMVGGATKGMGNVISGNNGPGVRITGVNSTGNQVQGNTIGPAADGAGVLGNDLGVAIDNGASNNVIGGTTDDARNVIATNFGDGVVLQGDHTTNNQVQGNFIGTNADGADDLGNGGNGVTIAAGTAANTIGGADDGAGNIISGNGGYGVVIDGDTTTDNQVTGNSIGTDKDGKVALGNQAGGIGIFNGASFNTIGGTTDADSNTISGNQGNGIDLQGSSNLVQGNNIGTDKDGLAPLGNTGCGLVIANGAFNTIGGATDGAGNTISANGLGGMQINGAGASGNQVQGNNIGVDTTGKAALGNQGDGLSIFMGSYNTIGGTVMGAGNTLSANAGVGLVLKGGATRNVVQGNNIGLDTDGKGVLGNGSAGVYIFGANDNIIGGTVHADGDAKNNISGNQGNGVQLDGFAAGNTVLGNNIGVDDKGGMGLGNAGNGIFIGVATGNVIGGVTIESANTISANGLSGIELQGSGNVVQGNNIGTDTNASFALPNGYAGVHILGNSDNQIGGDVVGAGNVISGNGGAGVVVEGKDAKNNLVQGNTIGLDMIVRNAVGNGLEGVLLTSGASDNTIGGTDERARNIISGNGADGLVITGPDSTGNVVEGNSIGTNADGTAVFGNAFDGVKIEDGTSGNSIGGTDPGAGNRIADNMGNGVEVTDGSVNNGIRTNSIFDNGGLGIVLNNGGNDNAVAPVLTSAVSSMSGTTIQGSLDAAANTTSTLEFFSDTSSRPDGTCQGRVYLGSVTVTTDDSGHANFTASIAIVVPVGQCVTASATDPGNDTSRFALAQTVN